VVISRWATMRKGDLALELDRLGARAQRIAST
jgi:hypothetical protein